ncbi:DNA damage-regulated autophagy modulator protein 1-like [Pseudophryne corroboree]|uniref:DNA damage-regulated autophagy modulator protein 1-like n=1 Tax=Pseudophryne corroboree TaxID=495146 RepID=UPI00308182CB
MEIQGLAFLPCLWVIWTFAGVITTLSMTIIGGHIEKFIPYISDTGTNYPESIIFTVVFSVSAALGVCTMYVMYKRMTSSIDVEDSHPIAQKILLLIGRLSCIGILSLALVQTKLHPNWHFGATLLAITSGLVYNISQAFYLYAVCKSKRPIRHLRAALCLVTLLTFLTLVACKIVFIFACNGGHCEQVTVVSAVGEWVIAATLMLNNLTYIPYFQELSMKCPSNLQQDWICLRERVNAGPEYP